MTEPSLAELQNRLDRLESLLVLSRVLTSTLDLPTLTGGLSS